LLSFPSPVSGFRLCISFHTLDVLACPECGGRLQLLATIEEAAVVEKILRHLGLPVEPPAPARARAPTWLVPALPGIESDAEASQAWIH
jgi:uncharacterized protein YbaR (Trm112 family)